MWSVTVERFLLAFALLLVLSRTLPEILNGPKGGVLGLLLGAWAMMGLFRRPGV